MAAGLVNDLLPQALEGSSVLGQHFHQRVEMRFGNVHVSVGRLHVTAFVLARATAELANLVGQAFLEGLGLGVLEVAADARVFHGAVDKIIDQARDARLFAQRLVQACGRGG